MARGFRNGSDGDTASAGLDETTPLIGAFGYLKPYKRIAESLRALRRLVRMDPRVRMILVGEPHPEFPVGQLIRTLDLRSMCGFWGLCRSRSSSITWARATSF